MRHLFLAFVCIVTTLSNSGFCVAADDPSELFRLKELGAEVNLVEGNATKISFNDCSKLGEAEFRLIGQFHQQKSLILHGQCNGLTDKTLPNILELTNLENLSTDRMQITDKGLANFTRLTNLRVINFFHPSYGMNGFNGRGFAALKDLPHLESLTIAGSPFNDKGMAAVAEITKLKHFRTWHTYQTQAGNQFLTKLTQLKSLWLGQRLRRYDGRPNLLCLDDSTFDVLIQLKTLESLTLHEAKLSLASLRRLREIPKLSKLVLLMIDVPAEDIDTLKTELPAIKIEWKPLTEEEREKLTAFLKQ
jgi:hypothetical protein